MDWISFAHPVIRGAITGWLSAALIDFQAFKAWQSFNEALTYNWSLALWRWGQGVVTGIVSALGLEAVA